MAKSTGSARSKLSKYVVEVVEVVELGTVPRGNGVTEKRTGWIFEDEVHIVI